MTSPDRRSPLACNTCQGDGIVSTRDMWSADGTRDLGGCPDCVDGTRRCQVCGEGYTIGLDSNGYAVDWPCWQADRAEQRGRTAQEGSQAARSFGGVNEAGTRADTNAAGKVRPAPSARRVRS